MGTGTAQRGIGVALCPLPFARMGTGTGTAQRAKVLPFALCPNGHRHGTHRTALRENLGKGVTTDYSKKKDFLLQIVK